MSDNPDYPSFDQERPTLIVVLTVVVLLLLFAAVPLFRYLGATDPAHAATQELEAEAEENDFDAPAELVSQVAEIRDTERFTGRMLQTEIFEKEDTGNLVVQIKAATESGSCDGIHYEQLAALDFAQETMTEDWDQLRLVSYHSGTGVETRHFDVVFDRETVDEFDAEEVERAWDDANVLTMPSHCL